MRRKLDLTGQRFGNLVAIEKVPEYTKKHSNVAWLCKCDCGAKLIVRSDNLRSKHSTRCSLCGGTAQSVFVKGDEQDDRHGET